MGKPQFYPKIFDIDVSVCMSCQICVEVCPFEAIKMDKEFELSRRERFDALLMRKDDLAKSNDYYRRISPTDAAQVDAKLAAAAEAAAKESGGACSIETCYTRRVARPNSRFIVGGIINTEQELLW